MEQKKLTPLILKCYFFDKDLNLIYRDFQNITLGF